jgi:Kef-type K+ transport system membrane component KefB
MTVTLLLGGLATMYFLTDSLKSGLSVAGGVFFSLANLLLLWKMIQELITTGERSGVNVAGVAVLKFIVLWGAFIAVMALGWASPIYLGIGFTILLFVFAMKGFGQWLIDYFKSSEEE